MTKTDTKMTYGQLYGESGLMYIRYDAPIETRPNGQKKIGHGKGPSYSKLETQPVYRKGDGAYYSLLMGREIKPGRFVVLLDFDNKEDETSRNGMELLKKLRMNKRGAPKQSTPSKGFHYLFYVDADQKDHINSRTTITYEGVKYNMDVKFKNSLCNCAPSKIEDYGKYEWEDPYKLLDIPKLPNDLYEMIRTPTPTTPTPITPKPKTMSCTSIPSTSNEPEEDCKASLKDIRALCCCLSIAQLDDYSTWIRIGMILKKVGAPLNLWEAVSQRSKKFKPGECAAKWGCMKPRCFSINSLIVLAKQGSLEMYEKLNPTLSMNMDIFQDDVDYKPTLINTPYLTTKGEETNQDQRQFKQLVDEFMEQASKKSLVIRSRYGSGKTTFLQDLIKERKPKKVLFITYRQTLARDIMRNFSKLGFKNYLDSYEDPRVWNSPRLIVQLDSLLNILLKNDKFCCESIFDLNYDMIVLDESESLLNHLDEKTMENKEIQIWDFFDKILDHGKKLILLDGDMSQRSLSFARSYGEMSYINNTNTDGNKIFNLMQDEDRWKKTAT